METWNSARKVYVAPFASVRGDEGQPICIGEGSNIQDGVVLHVLETEENGEVVEKNLVEYGGKKYAVYIGKHVSLAHQAQVHGPALVDETAPLSGCRPWYLKPRWRRVALLNPAPSYSTG